MQRVFERSRWAFVAAILGVLGCSQTPTFDRGTGGADASSHSTNAGPDTGGHHPGSTTSSGSGAGGPSGKACDSCMTDTCTASKATCDADPGCHAILACLAMDPLDLRGCVASHASAVPLFTGLTDCFCSSCGSDCDFCAKLSCINNQLDPGETTQDCGGACGKCQGTCDDGEWNNSESDVDCGGPCPKLCDVGKQCKGNTSCASGFCVDGVCCDSACGNGCSACSAAKKGDGSADGTCGAISAGNDPNHACSGGDACNGDAAAPSCRCHDGAQNGSEEGVDCGGSCSPCGGSCPDGTLDNQETDLDCGGPSCATKCAGGKHCAVDTDCTTGSCHAGACCQPESTQTLCAHKCGNVTNSCGQTITCPDACPAGTACGVKVPNACDCIDTTACSGKCGTITDSCGKTVDCGGCTGAGTCQSDHTCQCSDPTACNGKCGSVTNACGVTVDCGGCPAPATCGGGGAHICGCVDDPIGSTCGNTCNKQLTNNCSHQVNCPDCGGGDTCASNQCCTPHNHCGASQCAGSTSNDCGGTTDCTKTCPGGQECNTGSGQCCTPHPNPCGSQCTGSVDDGCGHQVACTASQCGAPAVCTAGGQCCTPDDSACDDPGVCGTVTDACGVAHICSSGALYCRQYCGCTPAPCSANYCDCGSCTSCILPCQPL